MSTSGIDRSADDVQDAVAPSAPDQRAGKASPGDNGPERLPLRPTAAISEADCRRAREIRLAMIANGYSPLSVSSPANPYVPPHVAGKKPSVEYIDDKPKSWAEGHSLDRLMRVSLMSTNTGLLLGGEQHLVAIDIDPSKTASADERKEFAGKVLRLLFGGTFGPLFMQAPGRARFPGSVLLLVRADAEIRKLRVDGQCGAVELLSQGQQVVVDGLHPSSTPEQPSRWRWNGDRSPWTVPVNELPIVAGDRLERLLLDIEASGVLGPSVVNPRRANGTSNPGRRPEAYLATLRFRELIAERNGLIRPAARALVAETGASGTDRHNTVVAICGRLSYQGWSATDIEGFLVPLVNEHFGEGDWTKEIASAIDHAARRQAAENCGQGASHGQQSERKRHRQQSPARRLKFFHHKRRSRPFAARYR